MTTASKRPLSYLTISDIHLYNDLNPTAYILGSLDAYFDGFSDGSRFAKLDIIFIAGDMFDYYRDTKHPDVVMALLWMRRLMAFCIRNKIKLRVLEGTPGHDYKQSKMFTPLAESFGSVLDYKYIEVLSIEKMEDLGLSVLYVPDEWAGSAAVCQEQVQELLDRNGLEQVDIACMHGMADFQIPELGEHPLKHDTQWYLNKVKFFINIGHDHTHKTFDRWLVQGSFDRIAHGEEGKKGGIVCTLDPVNGNSFEFVENKRARIFKTIVVKTKDADKAIQQVNAVLEKLPENAHVRISSLPDNPIFSVFEEFKRTYRSMIFKKHKDKKQGREEEANKLRDSVLQTATYVPISIHRDNVVDMIFGAMPDTLTESEKTLLRTELEAVL